MSDTDAIAGDDALIEEILKQAEPGVTAAMQALETAETVYFEAAAHSAPVETAGISRSSSGT